MSLIYKNITGSTAVTLIDSYTDGDISQKLDSINLCNVHDTDSVDVDIYYYSIIYQWREVGDYNLMPPISETYTYYVLKNVTIPKGVTLNLDTLLFNNIEYCLKIKLSASDSAVDVVIESEIKGTITTNSTLILKSTGAGSESELGTGSVSGSGSGSY